MAIMIDGAAWRRSLAEVELIHKTRGRPTGFMHLSV